MIKIELKYPEYKMINTRERLDSVHRDHRYLDRIPVQAGLQPNYFLAMRGVGFLEYFGSAKAQVYHQLMNIKWRLENIEEDYFTGGSVSVSPDFQNIATAANFSGVNVVWDDINPPRIERFIHDIGDMRRLVMPEVTDGICGKKIKMFFDMQEEIKNYNVTLNGSSIGIRVTVPGVEGPFTDALDLAGENLLVWMLEYPEDIKRFLQLLSEALVRSEQHIRHLCPNKRKVISITADGAEMLSPEMFKEFVLPYNEYIFSEFPEYKEFHMCGKLDHLMDIVAGMDIDHLIAFGFPNDIRLMREKIGRRFVISGGISPMLLKSGSKSDIVAEINRYIDVFEDTGAYILGDGASIAPGTPVENINLLCETAEKSAVRHPERYNLNPIHS